jgi:uncharacterized protein
MFGLMIIGGIASLIGMVISNRLTSKFNQYSQVALRNGMSGAEIAEAMLRHYGIFDVKVLPAQGFLTDHYNPSDKTVNLSEAVYNSRSVSAAAVAAHECGHAVQHATAYSALQMRSALVPVVKISSGLTQFLMLGAALTFGSAMGKTLLLITVICYGANALFTLITLPVEFDASRRALVWLESTNVTLPHEQEGAKDALWWAAMTYVASAMAALVSFLYLLWSYMSRD